MSQIKKPLILSVSQKRADAQTATITEKIQNEKRVQVSIFHAFNAKRNSAQIERYFTESADKCHLISTFTISIIFCFAIVIFQIIYPTIIIQNSIKSMTEEILELTINDIQRMVTTEVNLTFFLSNLLTSMFIQPSMINVFDIYSMEMANEVSRLFYETSKLYTNMKIIKLYASSGSEGFYVGINTQNNIIREYSPPSNPQVSTIFVFPENSPNLPDVGNDFFPFSGNSDTYRDFDLTSTDWFRTARDFRHPVWTNTSDGWTIMTSKNCTIPLIYSTVPYFKTNTVRSPDLIIGGSVNLNQISQYLQTSFEKSTIRFAILRENSTQGELLTYSTIDQSVCQTGTRPLTLYDVEDELWIATAFQPLFERNQNFTFSFGGQEFFFLFIPFEISPGIVWSLVSIYAADSVSSGIGEDLMSTPIITMIILFIVVSLAFIITTIFLKYAIHLKQTKILSKTSEDKKSGHIDMRSIIPTIELLRKLLLSHADNHVIKQKVSDIIHDLVASCECEHTNISEFYLSISDDQVRNKFIEQFGCNPHLPIKKLQEPSTDDREIVAKYNQKHPFSKLFSRIMTTQDFDKKLSKIVASRNATILYEGQIIKKKVPAMVQCFNVLNPLFKPDEFEIFINKVLKNSGELTLPLLYDSVEFMFIISKRNIQPFISNTDIVLAAFIAIFVYHLSMTNRIDPSLPYINRYFQIEHRELSSQVYPLLNSLYHILASKNQEHLNRWRLFSELVIKITLEDLPVWNMRLIIEKTSLIIQEMNTREYFRDTKMVEAVALLKTLYIGGQVSMFFHSRKSCYDLQNIFIPIHGSNRPKSLIRFLNCLIRQFIKPVFDTYAILCGEDFIHSLKGIDS